MLRLTRMELPARLIRDFVRAAGACGVGPEAIYEGSPTARARRGDAVGRVSWDEWAQMILRVDAAMGSAERMEEVGRLVVAHTSDWAFVRLARHAVDPVQLLRIAFQWVGPAMFPHVKHEVERRADGTLRLALSLPEPYAECEPYFRMCVGGIRSIPTLVGLDPALVVVESIGPRGAVYAVRPPVSRTVMGRLRRAVRALRGEGALFDEMAQQHEAMQAVFGALLRTQDELHQFMERIPEPLLVHREGVIAWANPALIRALACANIDDLRGKRLVDFVLPAEKDLASERLSAPMSLAGPETYRLRAMDGQVRTFELSLPQTVIFDGAPARMALARDVTERNALRDQLVLSDRMTQLGLLAAGVAHEINNPLAYALAAADRAKSDLAAGRLDAVASGLDTVREGGERVRAITSDLRTFARGAEQRVEAVDVSRILRATIDLAGANIRTRGRLETDLRPLPLVRADEGRLGQVFMNLLVNALDAVADREPGATRIGVVSFTDDQGRAVIEIEDNGHGIPDGVVPHIFEPFFTTKGPRAGSGLGLAICHRIVVDAGGTIEVSSSEEGGAKFRVVLPGDPGDVHRERAPASERRRLRVLVVDDEPLLARALGGMLGDHHDVDVLTSGEEALASLEAGSEYDVVLCDLMMDGIGGMDVYERLRTRRPEVTGRLVFMTGGAFSARAQRFLSEVKNRCLDKPFKLEEVLGALEEASAAHA
jgi:signal transduction histidine kinase/ActR/RegA family two-component response regulator